MSRQVRQIIFNLIAVAVVVFVGLKISAKLAEKDAPPASQPREAPVFLVETITPETGTFPVRVRASGTLVPAREVQLQAQVTGRVVWTHPQLIPGGRIAAGEALVKLDRRDFEVAVTLEENALEQAKIQLELEHGRQAVAQREWTSFREDTQLPNADSALALREPQLRAAELAVQTAETRLRKAKLDLSRTVVEAPFDLIVKTEAVEEGQLVSPQSALATLIGTENWRVDAAIPMDSLSRIRFPEGALPGAAVTILQGTDDGATTAEGTITALAAELTPAGRMARVLVDVPRPLSAVGPAPLLLGAFVELQVDAGAEDGIEIQRSALREGNMLWLATAEGTLAIVPVDVRWEHDDKVVVHSANPISSPIIVSHIPTPVEGMRVRQVGEGSGR